MATRSSISTTSSIGRRPFGNPDVSAAEHAEVTL